MGMPSKFLLALRHDGGTPITTSAWTQLSAALGSGVSGVQIYNGTTKLLKLGYGAAGAEKDWLDVGPGLGPVIPAPISKGVRLAVKAIDADTTAGYISVNLLA